MFDAPAARLAVAWLVELPGANAFRARPDRPLQGYCLLNSDGRTSRATIYLENAETLVTRTPEGHFYYEGWLSGADSLVSLGAFNASASGEASCSSSLIEDDALRARATVRVTAEPFGGSDSGHTPVLEGALTWLHGAPAIPQTAAQPEYAVVASADPKDGRGAEPQPGSTGQAEAPGAAGQADQPDETRQPVPDEQPRAQEPELPAGEPPAPDEAPPERPDSSKDTAIGFKLYPEPATPVSGARRTIEVPLAARHPLAPKASGSAVLRLGEGAVIISMRGLPSPPSLGKAANTGRPLNSYRAWLVNQRSGAREPLGLCARVWGENFRFQTGAPLPLGRFDTILITADDRTAAEPNPSAPHVLMGTYRAE